MCLPEIAMLYEGLKHVQGMVFTVLHSPALMNWYYTITSSTMKQLPTLSIRLLTPIPIHLPAWPGITGTLFIHRTHPSQPIAIANLLCYPNPPVCPVS